MLNEKKLSKAELNKREDIIMKMKKNKSALVKKYGKDAEKVMYGRATNIAKKQAESMENTKLREMIKSALMAPGMDPEVGEDRYKGEQDLATASHALDQLEAALKAHDWYYMMSDDNRAYQRGSSQQDVIRSIMKDLEALGYGKDAKDLYNQYAPFSQGGPDLRMKEAQGKDMDKDGDIDSDDYMAAKDAAIKKAKGEVDEDLDLGHQDNEPHMVKAELYRIGKYAMELYAMVEEFEEMGTEVDFPGWWQSKITTAVNNMISAKHYLDFETKEPAIDAIVDKLTGEEPHEGEPEPLMINKIAEKLTKSILSKKKTNEQFIAEELANFIKNGQTLDEGFFDRLKAKVKGATAGVGQALKNVGAAAKGDLGSIQNTAMVSGMAKLNQKAKTLDKELNDVINDVNKLFPASKLEKNPQLKSIIDQYKIALDSAKTTNAGIASGKASQPSTSTEDPEGIKTGVKVKVNGKEEEAYIEKDNSTYVKDDEGNIQYVTSDKLKSLKYGDVADQPTTTSEPSPAKKGPARDEKGRFVTNKKPDIKPELIDNNYEMTKKVYNFKGKNYQVQVDKKDKKEYFKHEDGRIMDVDAIERMKPNKKAKVAETLAKQLKEND